MTTSRTKILTLDPNRPRASALDRELVSTFTTAVAAATPAQRLALLTLAKAPGALMALADFYSSLRAPRLAGDSDSAEGRGDAR